MKKVELLAPAGNYSKFLTAMRFGADAVYIGGKNFSLRAFSDNFTDEDMKKAVEMGISREAAIQAATINPARSIGMEGQVGSLEAGKYANIVVASQTLSLKQVILKGKMIKSA